ncbi:MAG: hypothetical protein ACI9FG_000974 [Crocinitomicaceae bacterium]|jgi:hypothetical protein
MMKLSTAKNAKGTKVVDDETFLPRIHTDLTNQDKQVKLRLILRTIPPLDS